MPAGASNGERLWLQRRERNLKRSLWEPCHLLQAHFAAQRGHWVHNHQSANTFFSLPISACSFWWLHAGTASSSVSALLCWASGCELRAGEQFRFQRGFLFPVRRICLRLQPATDRPAGGGWRPDDRWDVWFRFFDFFHVMASDKDKFIAPSMRDRVLCSQLMAL